MATSKLFFLSSLLCICLHSCCVFGQEDPMKHDPFEEYENPFRDAPKDETVEQRALALLQSQKYSIQNLESKLKNHRAMLSQEEERRIALQRIITDSLDHHFQGSAVEKQFALKSLSSFLSTYPSHEGRKPMIWLEGSIEDHLEKGLASDELRSYVIKFFERHLTSKGVILGYQPSTGSWRPISDVIEKEVAELRNKLSIKVDCYYPEFTLEEVLDDLSMISGVQFHNQLSEEQKSLKVDYINDHVSIAEALSDILAKHDLDYVVNEQRVQIGSKDDRNITNNEIFVVRGLLSSEVSIKKLIELIKTAFKDQQPEFHLVDQYTLATIGTETQLNKVAKYLGGFRPSSATSAEPLNTTKRLHPAAEFANRIVKAIHDQDSKALEEFANVSGEESERFHEFVKDIESWFQGVNKVSELRRNGDSYFAKIRTFGNEVMVIRMDKENGNFVLSDFNSPSVQDYQELEMVPLTQERQ